MPLLDRLLLQAGAADPGKPVWCAAIARIAVERLLQAAVMAALRRHRTMRRRTVSANRDSLSQGGNKSVTHADEDVANEPHADDARDQFQVNFTVV